MGLFFNMKERKFRYCLHIDLPNYISESDAIRLQKVLQDYLDSDEKICIVKKVDYITSSTNDANLSPGS